MRNPPCDIGDDLCQLGLSVRTTDAAGEYPHRPIVFPDAVDPAGKVILRAERYSKKAIGDFAVGEGLLFGALPRRDRRIFSREGWRDKAAECDRYQSRRDYPWMQGPAHGDNIDTVVPAKAGTHNHRL
jgi:hypothetical protein